MSTVREAFLITAYVADYICCNPQFLFLLINFTFYPAIGKKCFNCCYGDELHKIWTINRISGVVRHWKSGMKLARGSERLLTCTSLLARDSDIVADRVNRTENWYHKRTRQCFTDSPAASFRIASSVGNSRHVAQVEVGPNARVPCFSAFWGCAWYEWEQYARDGALRWNSCDMSQFAREGCAGLVRLRSCVAETDSNLHVAFGVCWPRGGRRTVD